MKKLFTLLALLSLCFGAKAEVKVDGYVDFSKFESLNDVPFVNAWNRTGVDLKDGCLHYYSAEATANAWDIQYGIGGFEIVEGLPYTVEIVLRGEPAGNIANWSIGGVDHWWPSLEYTTEFTTFSSVVNATKADNKIFFQHGNIVGDLWIQSIKVSHDTKDEIVWENCLVNGDAEGDYAEVPCVVAKVNFGDNNGAILPAKVVTEEDGNKAYAVYAGIKKGEAWDNQLWIQAPMTFKAGDNVKISFKYKAAKEAKASTQQHGAPGAYQHWQAIGDVNFKTEWQTFATTTISVEKDGFQTIAFNLSEIEEENAYYFDDIEWLVNPDKNPIPQQATGETPAEFDLEAEAEALFTSLTTDVAMADYAWWTGLCEKLTAAMKDNEESITADTRQAIEEFMKEDNYPSAIQAALDDAIAAHSSYECPFDKEFVEEQVNGWIEEIKAIAAGELPIYTENAAVSDGIGTKESKNMPYYNTPVSVDVYNTVNGTRRVVLKSWDGVEGSDLTIAFTTVSLLDEEDAEPQVVICGIEQTVDGEVVSDYVEDEEDPMMSYVTLLPQAGEYEVAQIYLYDEMTNILVGEGEEAGLGQVSLYGIWAKQAAVEPEEGEVDPGFGGAAWETVEAAYMLAWPGEPVYDNLSTVAAAEVAEEGEKFWVELNEASVTAVFDMDDYKLAYVEEHNENGVVVAAVKVITTDDIEAGMSLSGVVAGTWCNTDEGEALVLFDNKTTAETVNVGTGLEIIAPNELVANAEYLCNRLVTVYNTKDCPIVIDEDLVTIGEGEDAVMVYDIYRVLGEDFQYPDYLYSVSGILVPQENPMTGEVKLVLAPRSLYDLETKPEADLENGTDYIEAIAVNFGLREVTIIEPNEENDFYVPIAYVATADGVNTWGGKFTVSKARSNDFVLIWTPFDDILFSEDLELVFTIPAGCLMYANGLCNTEYTYAFTLKGSDVTGIDSVATENASVKAYNLNGIEVKAMTKGLYIVNGKKVVK